MDKINPFAISFGKKPVQFVPRLAQTNEIIDDFDKNPASGQIYMIAGVRGSGKTVMMTSIAQELGELGNWVVIELNPERDLLQGLAAKLYDIPYLQPLFLNAKINLSAFGIGANIEFVPPAADIESALTKMFGILKKQKKKVLITIDEVSNNENVRIFASAFQIFIRQELPVYLLMTGLYENIYDLQNQKTLTFLYRAPKINLAPLNYTAVRSQYQSVFDIPQEDAGNMAGIVKGYSFAYQVLGYLFWKKDPKQQLKDLLPDFDQYMAEYVYEKIWSELSDKDKKVLEGITEGEKMKVQAVRDNIGMESDEFSVYKERLKRKGIIDSSQYGYVSLSLPRFEVFVKNMKDI